jgi:hypothetical protein
MLATPHSRQRGFTRDVISPQDGQIRWDRSPTICGFSPRLQASSRIVNSTISTLTEILNAFIKATLRGEHSIDPARQAALDIAELIDFAQGRYRRHWQTARPLKSLRWENFRWTGLGQKT